MMQRPNFIHGEMQFVTVSNGVSNKTVQIERTE